MKRLRQCVHDAALAAGKVLARESQKSLRIQTKSDKSLVTHADLAAEKAALRILKKNFPHFSILTEESGTSGAGADGRFILDPLDGTTNYIHRFPFYCVSLAAEWQGTIVMGCVVHPPLKHVYFAERGKGATLNGKKIHVSKTTDIYDSLLTTGFTYRKDQWLHQEMQAFENLSRVARALRRPGSAALDLAYTALGVFDGFWERRLSPWDVAAGLILVEEAGGKVTDFQGRPFRVEAPEILASNRHLHDALQKELAAPA